MIEMNLFFRFVGYEYKKIFMRKSAIIVIVGALLFSVFVQVSLLLPGFTAPADESAWARMQQDREYARALSGRALDAELFAEALQAYADGNFRPYAPILSLMIQTLGIWGAQVSDLPASAVENFYAFRHERFAAEMNGLVPRLATEGGAERMIQMDAQLPTPWVFEDTGGYSSFFSRSSMTSLLLALVIIIFIAPIFANEHKTNVSQLILTSRHGKGLMIWAKVTTAVSVSIAISLLFLGVTFAVNMAVFGSGGGSAPIQLLWPHVPYNFTMSQSMVVFLAAASIRVLFITAAVLLMSAVFKSSFGALIFAGIWAFFQINMISPFLWLNNFFRLFLNLVPVAGSVFSPVPYDFFGLVVMPFVFEPLVAIVAGAALLPLAARAFKRGLNS